MQKIFNPDTAIITFKGVYTIAEVCTIYTEDSAVVTLCEPLEMPVMGQPVTINLYYRYEGDLYKCLQSHNRTEWPPLLTPALFAYYRANYSEILEWIIGEQVELGWQRIYNGIVYQVIQAHQTQVDWTPPIAITLWKSIDQRPDVIGVWTTGVPYKVNDIVTYLGNTYKCLQAHTSIQSWNPVATINVLWKLQ